MITVGRMLPLLLVAAVSFAEGQPGAVVSHEVPAGTRTVEQLAGDFPVGRWECWFEPRDHADIAASNTPIVPIRCEVILLASSVLELLPDTSPHGNVGWTLALKAEGALDRSFNADTAFTVAGSGSLYSRVTEFALVYGAGEQLEKLQRQARKRMPIDPNDARREVRGAPARAGRDAADG